MVSLLDRVVQRAMESEVESNIEGMVLRIERSSIHDGHGLRTVVFLKGCPLQCLWCSTPESQQAFPERGHIRERCSGCGTCVDNCPAEAISLQDGTAEVDLGLCRRCFACVAVCPNEAIKMYGRKMTAGEVAAEINKDEIFFFHSGGGVTISGGECLQQPGFVKAVLRNCRSHGIDTAIETSLFVPWGNIVQILPYLNSIYVDLKHPDSKSHREIVGVDNSLILANLKELNASSFSGVLHLRVPLIPGVNDSDDALLKVLDVAATLEKLYDIEILPYHRLGAGTYAGLGRAYAFPEMAAPSKEYILERVDFLRRQRPAVPVKVGGGME